MKKIALYSPQLPLGYKPLTLATWFSKYLWLPTFISLSVWMTGNTDGCSTDLKPERVSIEYAHLGLTPNWIVFHSVSLINMRRKWNMTQVIDVCHFGWNLWAWCWESRDHNQISSGLQTLYSSRIRRTLRKLL